MVKITIAGPIQYPSPNAQFDFARFDVNRDTTTTFTTAAASGLLEEKSRVAVLVLDMKRCIKPFLDISGVMYVF